MILRPTVLPGVMEILPQPARDARGAFFRAFCAAEFAAAGFSFQPVQVSFSENARRHTLRGMHWQAPPAAETKLIRCVRGAVHDVPLDLRPASPTHGRHVAMVLAAVAGNAILIPPGCAHGFLTLTDDAVLEYMMDAPQVPSQTRGVRWNDPRFAIRWPATPALISDRDAAWPDYRDEDG